MGALKDVYVAVSEMEKMTRPSHIDKDVKRHAAMPGLPSTAELLLAGGDARIALGPDGIANKYGCTPFPDPAQLSFGSSTASVISESAFAAADRLHQQLLRTANNESHATIYARELKRIRPELKSLCGVADMPDLDVVFAASGTDLHLISAQIASGSASFPTRVIMVGAEETGSGVPAALAGRHFSTRSALGQSVEEGTPLAGGNAIEVSTVPIRLADGRARPIADIDADVESLVNQAVTLQRRVLLILIDVSKTGMIAPSPACAAALHRRLPESVEVLVDACQFRIASSTLRAYLEQGFMVALTGSKFVGGPTFAGALLLPASVTRHLRARPLPLALSAYSARADWPDTWPSTRNFDNVANFGLLLRWEAALEELRAFRAVPEADVAGFLQAFDNAINHRLQNDPLFAPLAVPQLDRHPFSNAHSWDQFQTIFPFLLYRPTAHSGRAPLSREQTMQIYRLLQVDLGDGVRCQLGQPVACGNQNGMPVSALRICASARLIVDATAQHGKNASAVIASALAALDKAAMLVKSELSQK